MPKKNIMADAANELASRFSTQDESTNTFDREVRATDEAPAAAPEREKWARLDLRLRTNVKQDLFDLAEMDGISATAFLSSLIQQRAREQREDLERYRQRNK